MTSDLWTTSKGGSMRLRRSSVRWQRGAWPFLLALGCCTAAAAQGTWEYTPYRVQVWVALAPGADLTERLYERIARAMSEQAEVAAGVTWDISTQRCRAELLGDAVGALDLLTADAIKAVVPQLLKDKDKLVLVSVREDPTGYLVQARELDCTTRLWSPTVSRQVLQTDQLPAACFAAVCDAFQPLARIVGAKGVDVEIHPRAGGLVTQDACVSRVEQNVPLLPVIRRDDKQGEPLENAIQSPAWTFLSVTGRKGTGVQCRLWSGLRINLGGRSSARMSKVALAVKTAYQYTDLRVTSPGATPQPLPAYDVYVKAPDAKTADLLGPTDWRGVQRIPAGQGLRVVQIKHGGRLLTTVPLVPGQQIEQTVAVPNDDLRLLAEGYVKGFQNRIMDVVARRQLCVVRFRRSLEKKELDQARKALDDLRKLEGRTELTQQLDLQRQRLTSTDKRMQAKIDKLFGDARQVLVKFLDPYAANNLQRELAQTEPGKK